MARQFRELDHKDLTSWPQFAEDLLAVWPLVLRLLERERNVIVEELAEACRHDPSLRARREGETSVGAYQRALDDLDHIALPRLASAKKMYEELMATFDAFPDPWRVESD
jgi:hypothetical protein